MSLALLPSRAALAVGVPLPFIGTGGSGALSYSVVSGGAGGTIGASSGLYSAPLVTGTDTIRVVDATGAEAFGTVMVGTALELFCDVIATEMDLDSERVFFWDQKKNLPTNFDLFIAVSALNPRPFGNSAKFDAGTNDLVQSVNMQTTLGVDVVSAGTQAFLRKEEVILALRGQYSQKQQELNSFRIFPISSGFVNLSEIQGARIPYRYNISVNIQYQVTKRAAVEYFSTFDPVALTTEP